MSIKIRFLGAAQNVTGSCFYVEANGVRFIVDCGLYQERDYKYRNWNPFPIPPASLNAVLLTHAHLDHCGLLPKLVKEGFFGRIICTEATTDIAKYILLDAAKIQEEDAAFKKKRHNNEGRRVTHPEIPLYTKDDAEAVFPFFNSVKYGQEVVIEEGVKVTFHDAGHILGSSMLKVRIEYDGKAASIIFSGDVGRRNTPILRDPTVFEDADYILVESTYGNRLHKAQKTIPEDLARIINTVEGRGGNIVIPSFAVERAQELLYWLSRLLNDDKIPHLPVFLDSPMAIVVTKIFRKHPDLFDEETMGLIAEGKHPCDFPHLVLCRTVDQSKMINHIKGTSIIIAGSGMCTGGRIKHHLTKNITRPESAILFIGYQASGTLGRRIVDGEKRVRILGSDYLVRAGIESIEGFSAHADRDELLFWLSSLKRPPRHLFIIHGEPEASAAFADTIREQKGWNASVANYNEEVVLD